MKMRWTITILGLAATLSGAVEAQAQPELQTSGEIRIWERTPTDTYWTGSEQAGESAAPTGSKIRIKTNVTEPTLTIVRPADGTANGTAMIVAPGGAFMALAWDLEGEEVARWLADRGITAFILKYRVGTPPRPAGAPIPTGVDELLKMIEPNRKLAMADARQAIRLVRRDASRFGIDPARVGMIGFSAGAMTTLGVATEAPPEARPDFIVPVYGMLASGAAVPADAPPAFIVTAADDGTIPPSASIEIFQKWTSAKRPAELHIYEKGQHGFGMRSQGQPVDHWPAAFEAWLAAHGFMKNPAETADGK